MTEREIAQLALENSVNDLKRMITGQEMSTKRLEEIVADLNDLARINVPNEISEENKNRYIRFYQNDILTLQNEMYSLNVYDVDQAMQSVAEKSQAQVEAARDFSSAQLDFYAEVGRPLKELIDEHFKVDESKLEGKSENWKKTYRETYDKCRSKMVRDLAVDMAKKAMITDSKNQDGEMYNRAVGLHKEFPEYLQTYKKVYEEGVTKRAKEDAMKEAAKKALDDYNNNKVQYNKNVNDAFPNLTGDSIYEIAFRSEYVNDYRLAYNQLQVRNGDHKRASEEEARTAEAKRKLQEIIEKNKESQSKIVRAKQSATTLVKKIKMPTFASRLLEKFEKWGQKQLYDVQDVPASVTKFALTKGFYCNSYSEEEKQRCLAILDAYYRILRLLGTSPERDRYGGRVYLSINDLLEFDITQEQRVALKEARSKMQQLEGLSHRAKTADELLPELNRTEKLVESVANYYIDTQKCINKARRTLKRTEENLNAIAGSTVVPDNFKQEYATLKDMLQDAINKKDLQKIEKYADYCEFKAGDLKQFVKQKEEPEIQEEPKNEETKEEKPIENAPQEQPEVKESKPQQKNNLESLEQDLSKLSKEELIERFKNVYQDVYRQKNLAAKRKMELEKSRKSLKSAKAAKRRVESDLSEALSKIDELTQSITEMKQNQEQMIRNAVKEQLEEVRKIQSEQVNENMNQKNALQDLKEGYQTFKLYTKDQLDYFIKTGGPKAMIEKIKALPDLGENEYMRQDFLRELHALNYDANAKTDATQYTIK